MSKSRKRYALLREFVHDRIMLSSMATVFHIPYLPTTVLDWFVVFGTFQ